MSFGAIYEASEGLYTSLNLAIVKAEEKSATVFHLSMHEEREETWKRRCDATLHRCNDSHMQTPTCACDCGIVKSDGGVNGGCTEVQWIF